MSGALWHSQADMAKVDGNETVMVRGEGAWVWDEEGTRYFDTPSSLWTCAVGHGRAEIADAMAAQVRTLECYSNFERYATRPSLDLAERLAELSPIPNAKVFLCNSGSEAIDTAAKLIRQYWQALGNPDKQTLVSVERGYHGLAGFGTSMVGTEAMRNVYGELVPGAARIPAHDADALAELVRERGAHTIAAFFCEPIIGSGGVLIPPPGYLEAVREICRENDIIFVADEVITGFGRTGALFASTRFGLEPDILVFAKGVTSGYAPLGGLLISQSVWAPFWPDGSGQVFRHGLTYSGHATACAAALANLEIIEREDLVTRVSELEPVAERALRALADHPMVAEVRAGVGLLGAVELTRPELAAEVAARCGANGIIGRVLAGTSLHFSPPFVTTAEEIEMVAEVFHEALEATMSGRGAE